MAESIEDAKSPERIESDVKAHFQRHPPIETVQEVLHTLLAQVGVG